MKKQTFIIGNILLLIMFLLLSITAKAQSYTSCVGGDPIYLPDPQVPSTYTLMWAQYSYSGSELYVVNNKVTIEKYFVGTIYVECYFKCVRQYTVAGRMYEDHQTGTTYFGIKCDPVYTTGLPDQLTMQVGETKTIDWSYRPPYVSRPNLTWTSSDYSVVDVNSNRLTAKKSGRAVVTVKSNAGPDEYINVTVEGGSDVIYVNSISLNETSVSLTEGSTKQLQATVLPSNATDKSVSWTSSNNSVAQVSSSGLVTAKSVGTATITCKANDGSGKSATCSVTVKSSNVEPVSIVLPNYIENIKVGQTITLVPTIAPSNATTTLSWTSSDNSVATVTQSGVVKGIKAGESKITVTTSNGKSAYCYVKVTEDVVYVSSISLNVTSVTLNVGDTKQLTATISPSNATDKSVSWTSNNNSVATVSSSGMVTAKSTGTVTITCKANDGSGTSATCSVTVKSSTVEPTGITLPYSRTIKVGESFTMTYTLTPSNATTTLTWSSDDSSIATVSSSGVVKGIKAGTTKIRVKTSNGKTDYCNVTVESGTVEPTGITLPYSKTVKVGETFTMTYTLTPSNATTTLTWSSDDISIATVSSSGVVKGIKAGTTKIRVKTANDKTDYCNVTVESNAVEPTSISLPASKTIKVGESFTMTYTLTPSNATTTLTWTSDDSNVASVSSSGVVKGINAGSTYINVKTSNGKTDYCKVTVEDDKPKEFTAKTVEGVEMKFQVISENEKTCQVGNGSLAISDSYSGNITIPTKVNGYSVIAIGSRAFHSSKISSIKIPSSIQKISSWALFNCRSLKSIDIPSSVTDIGERALSKSAIESIVVENGNSKYDSRNGCNAIIQTSSNELIAGCSKTVIPSSVNSIGDDAFYYCIDLYKIDIPLSIEKIGKAAFSYSGLTEAVIPNSVKSIGWHAFSWCDNLLHITIGSAVRTIDEYAFIANESLITVTSFIDNPFEIDTNVFKLFSLDIDNKPSNATLYVPKGKKSKYMSTAGWNMFRRIVEENDKNGKTFKGYSTEGVEMTFRVISESDKICQVGDNPYAGTDGSIYGRRAVSYNTSGNITIPSNVNGYKVVKIADLAFINCPDITSVEMPNTITDIGGYAFQKCSGLTSFSLPSSVEIIGKYAISMCSGLRKVTLPEGLVSVEDGLFWKDESLLTFNLPSTLKEIGYSVFIGCNSLTGIYSYMQTPCYFPSSIFENDAYNNATLFVPNGTKAAYTRQDYWYKFKNIVEFDPSGINDILMDNTKYLHIYDLNGHKLLTPQKGINIINGKKVFVK